MLRLDDTIAAVATPPGASAARGIIRISGPEAMDCVRRCFTPADGWPSQRAFRPRVLKGELNGDVPLPCDAYLWPSRRSYTREPVAELHMPGSPPLAEGALATVCRHGPRLAEPGEFTLRAFLAGRIDLTQAEAVLGVIDAEDRRALDIAISQLAGGLAAPLATLRCELIDLLADVEAGLDFAEEHIEFVSIDEIVRRLDAVRSALLSLGETLTARAVVTDLPRVAIIGWPNTGKSSLFNTLAGADRAMVSSTAGTTRDYLETVVNIGGLQCVLVDTAGTETSFRPESIQASAQSMTEAQRQAAELRLLCIDATRPPNEWERMRLRDDVEALVVLTKLDLCKVAELDRPAIETSAVTGEGLAQLRSQIAAKIGGPATGRAVASTAARCRDSVDRAIESVTTAGRLVEARRGDELVAAELRVALDELGRISGAVYTEDLLDRIFSRFCIGK